jgi:prophage regulatory protein|tara:strand:+ start:782 stop:994 length:213 start_codon:yes stop_codon:yes gene_type:complete
MDLDTSINPSNISSLRLERLPDVLARYPVGKSTWWAGVKSGIFPSPVKLAGGRCCAWRSEEIDKLIAEAK